MSANGEDLLKRVRGFLKASDDGELFPVPLPEMRRRVKGIRRSSLTVVAGYPSDGKTQFALQWADAILRAGSRVTIFSLEMDCLEVGQAMMTQGGVHPDVIQKRIKATAEDKKAMRSRAAWMSSISDRLRVVDHLYSLEDMDEYLDDCPEQDVVVIDLLHLMDHGDMGRGDNERRGLEHTTTQLKRFAKRRKCAVILLCHLSRSKEGGYPAPDNSQLRGTAMIEGTANHIVYVWRERDASGRRTNSGLVAIGKWRNGPTDWAVDVTFHVPALKFYEKADPAFKHAKQALPEQTKMEGDAA